MGEYIPQSTLASDVVSLSVVRRGESQSGEDDVERINPFTFYELSQTFAKLATLPEDTRVNTTFMEVLTAHGTALNLLQGKPVPLSTSRASAHALENALQGIIDRHFSSLGEGGQRQITFPPDNVVYAPWEIAGYRQVLASFETVFREEMRETATYYVPRRGIFYTPALVDSADEAFPDELGIYIPEKTRVDWKAAGRCLAFNILSASGIHVARAVEGTIEDYYQFFSGKPGDTLRSWYDYYKQLDTLRTKGTDPAPSEKVLAEIDQMRQDYRNPIMHPRVVLSEADARVLFANGESLIILMAQELKEGREKSGGVQQSLGTILGGILSDDRQAAQ